jgi:hypothetical protein
MTRRHIERAEERPPMSSMSKREPQIVHVEIGADDSPWSQSRVVEVEIGADDSPWSQSRVVEVLGVKPPGERSRSDDRRS